MRIIHLLFLSCIATGLLACTSPDPEITEINSIQLNDYETIISIEDEVLATPLILKYEENLGFFIYDEALGKVLHLDEQGMLIQEFGQRGRGPGEFQRVNNLFVRDSLLYVTDRGKFVIHRFHITGDLESTMSYGEIESQGGTPPPPPAPFSVRAMEINNQPFITQNGNVFISALSIDDSAESLFGIHNWEGEKLTTIGEIPEGSTFILNNEKIREDVQNRVVPTYYRAKAFPLNDALNPDEFFMVYTALPEIAKYDVSGQKLWEVDIPNTPEIDSVTSHFYSAMERMQRADIRSRILLDYYTSGVSTPNGHLFLAMDRSPVWIHEFNQHGELIQRYTFKSTTENQLEPIFDVDAANQRVFIITREGEIRAYSLNKKSPFN